MTNTEAKKNETSTPARYLDVCMVQERDGKSYWTKIGVAFPNKDGKGFNIELSAIPMSGKLVAREPLPKEE